MGRAALIAIACAPLTAHAGQLSLQLGLGSGIGWASRAGLYRDDAIGVLRFGIGVGRFLAIDAGVSEDAERIEAALRLGVRIKLFAPECWQDHFAPYLRGELAVVGASHLGSNYDALVGLGHWGQLASAFAWYGEADAVVRLGEVETVSARLELGIALTY